MKIAILGTRGIPNNYGGCEANAEKLAPRFLEEGHEVTVYCPHEHPYKQSEWNGVTLEHVYCPESRAGIWGTLLYDFLCLRHAFKSGFDVVLELGYVPVAVFYPLVRRRGSMLVTNMDGLEWKRSKWNAFLRLFTRVTEYVGAKFSDALISDNEAIKDHVEAAYGKHSYFIPYGAEIVASPKQSHLDAYDLSPDGYYMLLARLEPENNIEMILEGYLESGASVPFLVVGGTSTPFAKVLLSRYGELEGVRFLGGIFDYEVLSSLRWQSRCYFHGHSVGGTNPSLLEAMASRALIAIHDNPFNRAVVGGDAYRFASAKDVAQIINSDLAKGREDRVSANLEKIENVYTWENVARLHLAAFEEITHNKA